jgi:hypothetical protein
MMILFVATCVAVLVFVMRVARNHLHGVALDAATMMSCCGSGLGPSLERAAAQSPGIGNEPLTHSSPAFDEYREQTLRRLEREQSEFQEFVDHLRMAKDKAEFDAFIAERRNPPPHAAA